ncbi:hypothetical protein OIU78_010272 [Salix suchowensis]|nr:hypothetical protein OIU78_010272 [Salix suchowensis]
MIMKGYPHTAKRNVKSLAYMIVHVPLPFFMVVNVGRRGCISPMEDIWTQLLFPFHLAGIELELCSRPITTTTSICFRRERKVKKTGPNSSISCSTLRSFTYKELEEATGVFKEELGRGSLGIVYKGIMRSSSRNAIAVKKLGKLAQERERRPTMKMVLEMLEGFLDAPLLQYPFPLGSSG